MSGPGNSKVGLYNPETDNDSINPDGSIKIGAPSSLPLPAGAATSAKQLPDNHQVTVSNPITGFATEATLTTLQGLSVGEWDKVTQTQNATQDIWAFELNSTPTKTVTVTYVDSTKGTISTVVLS